MKTKFLTIILFVHLGLFASELFKSNPDLASNNYLSKTSFEVESLETYINEVVSFKSEKGILYGWQEFPFTSTKLLTSHVVLCFYSFKDSSFREVYREKIPKNENHYLFDLELKNNKWYLLSEEQVRESDNKPIKNAFRVQIFDELFFPISDFAYEGRVGKRMWFKEGNIMLIRGYVKEFNGIRVSMGKQILTLNDFGNILSNSELPDRAFNCSTANEWMYSFCKERLITLSYQSNCLSDNNTHSFLGCIYNSGQTRTIDLSKHSTVYDYIVLDDNILMFSTYKDSSNYGINMFGELEYKYDYAISRFDLEFNIIEQIKFDETVVENSLNYSTFSALEFLNDPSFIQIGGGVFSIDLKSNRIEGIFETTNSILLNVQKEKEYFYCLLVNFIDKGQVLKVQRIPIR